jgi:hypothetical protein
MRSILSVLCAVGLVSGSAGLAAAAGKSKAPTEKKQAKEIGDGMQKQAEWEEKILGPSTEKKIDHAKIQKLQAEEIARREKQDKLEQARKEREEAKAAAEKRNVSAPAARDVPAVEETVEVKPAKPVEKHDDAFVDKLLKGGPKKKTAAAVSATNDEVDQLLNAAKDDSKDKKPVAGKGGKGKGSDLDQLLATADKQESIKTTAPKPNPAIAEPVSAEAAAREAALKSIAAAAAAKAQEEKNRSKRPVVPDAAMLRAQSSPSPSSSRVAAAPPAPAPTRAPAPAPKAAPATDWNDPFAADDSQGSSGRSKRGKITAASVTSPISRQPVESPAPKASTRSAPSRDAWDDPFDSEGSGSRSRARPAAKPAPAPKPAAKPRPPSWKDPFA